MKKFIRNNDLTHVKLLDELFMLDLKANKYYSLNSTASYVWDMLYIPINENELSLHLIKRYQVDENIATLAVHDIILKMLNRNLIYEYKDA